MMFYYINNLLIKKIDFYLLYLINRLLSIIILQMDKSISFIRTQLSDWGIQGTIPEITSNIPIISCIGTSRDGKSTALNLYANWIIKNYDKESTLWNWLFGKKTNTNVFSPFVSMQTDEVVTNGIDYYVIPNKCVLFDCQGMQLKNAKHDHFLMLITYLFSNVIILTVRERLDLQVLNNCLAVFSFLSEIPEEYRRKDKPVLLLRIKDYQNIKQLKKNPNYLNELVEKWLEKSNDQYDQIKEAFQNTFNINVIATYHPIINDDGDVDIHSDDFLDENPTFRKFCETVYELSKDTVTPDILKSKESIEKLIGALKGNSKIDWKKLDLYYQITENELRKYAQEFILKEPLTDNTLKNKMNGSIESYNLYKEREDLIINTYDFVYNKKFKDVTIAIKNEVFNGIFNDFKKIVGEARQLNHQNARLLVQPEYDTYKNKFVKNSIFNNFLNKINEYFGQSTEIFLKKLKTIDYEVCNEFIKEINKEGDELKEKQNIINDKNNEHKIYIDKLINEYSPLKKLEEYTTNYLQKTINDEYLYNETIQSVIDLILQKIKSDINQIFTDNDKTWHLDNKKEIIESKGKMNYDISQYLPFISDNYATYYWDEKQKCFDKMGIIRYQFQPNNFFGNYITKQLNLTINNKINFIEINCNNNKFIFQMTESYSKKTNFLDCLTKSIDNEFEIIEEKTNDNLTKITIDIPKNLCFDSSMIPQFKCALDYQFTRFIMKYVKQNNICYSNKSITI